MAVMANIFDLSTPAKRFRFVAILEAFTWAGLLLGMFFKYFTGDRVPDQDIYPNEIGVQIFGMLHGAVFVLFIVVALLTARALKWNLVTTGLALLSSIPPFFTILFEWWAKRTGQLGELSATPAAAATARELDAV
ncbi:DUF3817 domain-containing protein [Rhodococcus sp. NPDC058532]|uniref:DUF3817 domain-containing protein n=1 Tax=Rhodococcus sp. NPDC058532 TaxID=3346540 RepID=UPI00364803FC